MCVCEHLEHLNLDEFLVGNQSRPDFITEYQQMFSPEIKVSDL